MTLHEYQARSAYMLRARRSYHRYSLDDWRNKGKGKGKSMVETESFEEKEEEEEEENETEPQPQPQPEIESEPEQFIRRKLRAKRGRGG